MRTLAEIRSAISFLFRRGGAPPSLAAEDGLDRSLRGATSCWWGGRKLFSGPPGKKKMVPWVLLVFVVLAGACGKKGGERKLRVLTAGSLSVPFRELAGIFEKAHPGLHVEIESHGSRKCARMITALGKPCDVFGSADYKVVEELLVPEKADFNIRFCTNEMVLAWKKGSPKAEGIDGGNWPSYLLEKGGILGRSDPDSDPCGYRTVMVLELAERHYGRPGLAGKILEKNGDRFVRPKETDLLALLEAGEIDFLFIYRSVALQHGLGFLRLPKEINLGDPSLGALYGKAAVKVKGKEPGEFTLVKGSPIQYSVTIPKDAPNRKAALEFLRFLLSPGGRAVMERNGQACLVPALCRSLRALPPSLRPFCREIGK